MMSNPADLDLAQRILAGDIRAAARLISRVEAADDSAQPTLRALYRHSGSARIVGISGPPGAGKSTLVDHLIEHYRDRQLKVAVVAVDPSSPLSGGAVLGDRVRMARHATDPGVFIRSLAARGSLGGVTAATADVLNILDAMGWDVILLETVGVGQNEVEVMRQVPAVVLVQNPGDGDAVQSVKAGTLEVAHVFVVNKADMVGADRVARQLQDMISVRSSTHPDEQWVVPIVMTEATNGKGVEELISAIDRRFSFLADRPEIARHEERARLNARVIELSSLSVRRQLAALTTAADDVAGLFDDVIDRQSDPHSVADALLARVSR